MIHLRPSLGSLLTLLIALPAMAQQHRTTTPAAGDPEAGATVFQHVCIMCHSVDPGVKIVGSSLYSVMKGPHANSAATVRSIVTKGKGQMPPMGDKLAEQDIQNLLAYLRKL